MSYVETYREKGFEKRNSDEREEEEGEEEDEGKKRGHLEKDKERMRTETREAGHHETGAEVSYSKGRGGSPCGSGRGSRASFFCRRNNLPRGTWSAQTTNSRLRESLVWSRDEWAKEAGDKWACHDEGEEQNEGAGPGDEEEVLKVTCCRQQQLA